MPPRRDRPRPFKVSQRLTLVRGSGHEERCVSTSDVALPLLVPK